MKMTYEWLPYVRWLHVAAASAWLGEVIVINVVLVPALAVFDPPSLREFVNAVFPRIFLLASWLAGIAALTGGVLVLGYTRGDVALLTQGRWGLSILIGGGLGLALTAFHFFLENRLARRVGIGRPDISNEAVADVHATLQVVPRVGLLVIGTVFLLMMLAAHGT